MPANRMIAAVVAFALPLLAVHAKAAELKVVSTTAFKGVLEELGPQFEKTTENKVTPQFCADRGDQDSDRARRRVRCRRADQCGQ